MFDEELLAIAPPDASPVPFVLFAVTAELCLKLQLEMREFFEDFLEYTAPPIVPEPF